MKEQIPAQEAIKDPWQQYDAEMETAIEEYENIFTDAIDKIRSGNPHRGVHGHPHRHQDVYSEQKSRTEVAWEELVTKERAIYEQLKEAVLNNNDSGEAFMATAEAVASFRDVSIARLRTIINEKSYALRSESLASSSYLLDA